MGEAALRRLFYGRVRRAAVPLDQGEKEGHLRPNELLGALQLKPNLLADELE